MARELTHREQMGNQSNPVFAIIAAFAVVAGIAGNVDKPAKVEAKQARVIPTGHVVPASVAASAPKLR